MKKVIFDADLRDAISKGVGKDAAVTISVGHKYVLDLADEEAPRLGDLAAIDFVASPATDEVFRCVNRGCCRGSV